MAVVLKLRTIQSIIKNTLILNLEIRNIMKILRISSKSIAFAALLLVTGAQADVACVADLEALYALSENIDSIEKIHDLFDIIMTKFKRTFESSFSEKSTERIDLTANNIAQAVHIIKEFVKALKEKNTQLKNNDESNSELCAFITVLVKIADKLERHFDKVYSVLSNGLKKKLNATAFTNQLKAASDSIVTEENFKEIDRWLDELQKKSPKEVALKVKEIRTDMNAMFRQYKKKPLNATLLAAFRKRLPY